VTNLLWVSVVTLLLVGVVYSGCLWLFRRCRYFPLAHPLAIGSLVLAGLVLLLFDGYREFQRHCGLFYWLLGPTTVALALPLYNERHRIREMASPLLISVLAGAVLSPAIAMLIAWGFGGEAILSSVATKSVTTPIALGIADKIGGLPELVAGMVIFTGVVGALSGPAVLKLAGIEDNRILGVVLGINAHGVGTASAFQISARCGAFASLAMALTGALTALILPLAARLL
jgi:putative effector of murein hydrolase